MKWVTKCTTCEEIEMKKKKPNRYYWHSRTENQALVLKSVHITNEVLHEVKVKKIE